MLNLLPKTQREVVRVRTRSVRGDTPLWKARRPAARAKTTKAGFLAFAALVFPVVQLLPQGTGVGVIPQRIALLVSGQERTTVFPVIE